MEQQTLLAKIQRLAEEHNQQENTVLVDFVTAYFDNTCAWADDFSSGAHNDELSAYANAFPLDYRQRTAVDQALIDAQTLSQLGEDNIPELGIRIHDAESGAVKLKIYGHGEAAPLSEVLPIFENFGFLVQTQHPVSVTTPNGGQRWIHEFEASHPQAKAIEEQAQALSETFHQVLAGEAESDQLNRLVLTAGLAPRQVNLVRAVARYLLQTNLPLSKGYLDELLAEYGEVTAALVEVFDQRLNPDISQDQEAIKEQIRAIHNKLDAIESRDADRVLRAFLGVIKAILRTNYYQRVNSQPKGYISFKLDPAKVPELPEPLPAYEAFVYSADVEGIHLRGSSVARGGLRWSDRREDFRTEVLGLVKAQMVKNSVIVPGGAKGGFVVKSGPENEDRDARQQRGIACYKTFLSGLLDITDNRRPNGQIIHPERVVRYDEDDVYLVVAADKGTASFSDIANQLSKDYNYWLDDAFASGGSAGYDHKKMAITARGGWESVKRHFRELGRDIQKQPFTAIGVGDMGGDVFGNGMLLSKQTRLVAAFNHMHIFIDPNPDAKTSYQERLRLFKLDRSTWEDYDKDILSAGGGIYKRSAKSIKLSEQAQKALGIEQQSLSPDELIHNILQAPVDLLWNGGIGTYVKARSEANEHVGDRANNVVRVNGEQLRCKVVGEGGNLGCTQAGRIEYARAGGRINTDAIDNSAGVNSSDIEVNIKVGLSPVEAKGELKREQRNQLLEKMTEHVSQQVLRNNYLQTQQLSLLEALGTHGFNQQVRFITKLEQTGLLNRAVEGLPDKEAIAERRRNHEGLTRPELAILLSYAKMSLSQAMIESELPDEAYFEHVLLGYFSPIIQKPYRDALTHHGLRREIITTEVVNQLVNRLGITVVHQMADDHGVGLAAVIRAYVLASAWLDAEALYAEIEALDNKIEAKAQYRMLERISSLVKHVMRWRLSSPIAEDTIEQCIKNFKKPVQQLLQDLPDYVIGDYKDSWQAVYDQAVTVGLPEKMAKHLASVSVGQGILSIVTLAWQTNTPVSQAAQAYFELGDYFGLVWLNHAIAKLPVDDYWDGLAQANLSEACTQNHQRIALGFLKAQTDIQQWCEQQVEGGQTLRARLHELQAIQKPSFTHLSIAVQSLSQVSDGSV